MLEGLEVVGLSVAGSLGLYAQSAYTKSGHWSPATVISSFLRPSRTLHDIKKNRLMGKGNSPGVIPVKTSRAQKGAGNRVMEPTICLDIAGDGRL